VFHVTVIISYTWHTINYYKINWNVPWTARFVIIFESLKEISVCFFILAFTKMHFTTTFYKPNDHMHTQTTWSPAHYAIGTDIKNKGSPIIYTKTRVRVESGLLAVRMHVTQVTNPAVHCRHFLPGLHLPSQPHSIITLWSAWNHTAWRQKHSCEQLLRIGQRTCHLLILNLIL